MTLQPCTRFHIYAYVPLPIGHRTTIVFYHLPIRPFTVLWVPVISVPLLIRNVPPPTLPHFCFTPSTTRSSFFCIVCYILPHSLPTLQHYHRASLFSHHSRCAFLCIYLHVTVTHLPGYHFVGCYTLQITDSPYLPGRYTTIHLVHHHYLEGFHRTFLPFITVQIPNRSISAPVVLHYATLTLLRYSFSIPHRLRITTVTVALPFSWVLFCSTDYRLPPLHLRRGYHSLWGVTDTGLPFLILGCVILRYIHKLHVFTDCPTIFCYS